MPYMDEEHQIVKPASKQKNRLLELLAALEPVADELPRIEDPPIPPEDIFETPENEG